MSCLPGHGHQLWRHPLRLEECVNHCAVRPRWGASCCICFPTTSGTFHHQGISPISSHASPGSRSDSVVRLDSYLQLCRLHPNLLHPNVLPIHTRRFAAPVWCAFTPAHHHNHFYDHGQRQLLVQRWILYAMVPGWQLAGPSCRCSLL